MGGGEWGVKEKFEGRLLHGLLVITAGVQMTLICVSMGLLKDFYEFFLGYSGILLRFVDFTGFLVP